MTYREFIDMNNWEKREIEVNLIEKQEDGSIKETVLKDEKKLKELYESSDNIVVGAGYPAKGIVLLDVLTNYTPD